MSWSLISSPRDRDAQQGGGKSRFEGPDELQLVFAEKWVTQHCNSVRARTFEDLDQLVDDIVVRLGNTESMKNPKWVMRTALLNKAFFDLDVSFVRVLIDGTGERVAMPTVPAGARELSAIIRNLELKLPLVFQHESTSMDVSRLMAAQGGMDSLKMLFPNLSTLSVQLVVNSSLSFSHDAKAGRFWFAPCTDGVGPPEPPFGTPILGECITELLTAVKAGGPGRKQIFRLTIDRRRDLGPEGNRVSRWLRFYKPWLMTSDFIDLDDYDVMSDAVQEAVSTLVLHDFPVETANRIEHAGQS